MKARDHYILNYKVASSGNGGVDVVVDGTEKTYTYTFEVPTKSTTKLQVKAANAWSNFAYLGRRDRLIRIYFGRYGDDF